MRMNDGADLGKNRLPVGQMTGDGGMRGGGGTEWRDQQRAAEPLILANDCLMLTYNSSHLLTVSFMLQYID